MTDIATGDSPTFDFISDANFRRSLTSDYRELVGCMETGAWKAVHVLAGSVVEAILADHLMATGYQKRSGKNPLTMDLTGIISVCKNEKVITERTADLSSVVRSYRNLIHPGRMIRLNEKVDRKSASIAMALVDVVADEVAAAKTGSYGFTAEQIANKLEKDSSALAVLGHFLKETNDLERERLAKDVIPDRYFLAKELGWGSSMKSADYQTFYRQVFQTLSEEGKANALKRFIKVLKEEGGEYVLEYENVFFEAGDLKYLAPSEAAFAKAHVLSRLNKEQTPGVLDVLFGVGGFLAMNEVSSVVDACVRMIAFGEEQAIRTKARDTLRLLYYETVENDKIQAALKTRLDKWITSFGEKELILPKTVLELLKAEWTGWPDS